MAGETDRFLSYARADDELFVKRLYRDLTADGWKVWWDRESMPSRGLKFTQEIRDAIGGAGPEVRPHNRMPRRFLLLAQALPADGQTTFFRLHLWPASKPRSCGRSYSVSTYSRS
jgi:hypothetical protein